MTHTSVLVAELINMDETKLKETMECSTVMDDVIHCILKGDISDNIGHGNLMFAQILLLFTDL